MSGTVDANFQFQKVIAAVGVTLLLIKYLAFFMTGSVAIFTDATESIVNVVAAFIGLYALYKSAQPADRDHPFGHARIEYVASMIVSFLVLYVGVTLFGESVHKIFEPTETQYSTVVLVILAISILMKLWLFIFGRGAAKRLRSDVMRATAADSLSDAAATLAVLVSALIAKFSGFNTDGYMGIIVAVIIMIAGIKILNDTKNSILGSAPEPEVVNAIKGIANEYSEIIGMHDLVVHNYGPGNTIASFHAEVDGSADVFVTHDIIDTVEKRLYNELGIQATIHMDPIVTDDEQVNALRERVKAALKEIDERLGMHDFRFVAGQTHSNLIFDVTVPFEVKESDEKIKELISSKISELDPSYFTVLTIDRE